MTETLDLTPDVLGLIRFLKALYADGRKVEARKILLSGWRLQGVDVDPVLDGSLSIVEAVQRANASRVVYLKRIADLNNADQMDHDGTEDLRDRRNVRPEEFES